jgi:hypothetical protein
MISPPGAGMWIGWMGGGALAELAWANPIPGASKNMAAAANDLIFIDPPN